MTKLIVDRITIAATSTGGERPVGHLEFGEIRVNTADEILFIGKPDGTAIEFASATTIDGGIY